MNDDQITRSFEEIEQAVRRDDPAFVRRLERQVRHDDLLVLSVFVLLAAGAVLLTVGLATLSWVVWAGGLGALGASVLVDRLRVQRLRREPAGPVDRPQEAAIESKVRVPPRSLDK